MATLDRTSVVGGSGGSNLLPKQVSSNIWKKATAESIVPGLANQTPIILGENTFPVLTKRPSASIVGENQQKPDSQIEVGSKTVKPIKAVIGLEFTMEAIMTNSAGVLGLLQEELGSGLARQVDLAILHKRQASDGSALTSGVEAITDTTRSIEVTDSDLIDDYLWQGYGDITNEGSDFTGFAFDPRMAFILAQAKDTQGRRIHPDIQMGQSVTTYSGLNARVSRTVSGQTDASTDTGIRAIGGDWSALRFGYVLQIGVKKIEYGDPFGNGDLQARNAVAYMAEAIFGWAIMDTEAFVKYTVPTEPEV